LEHPLDARDKFITLRVPRSFSVCGRLGGFGFSNPRTLRLIMNKKTKTMFVVLPGGFSSGGTMFSSYEYEDNSKGESYPTLAKEVHSTAVTRQTDDNRNWT
jgi:hypothetical protein